MLVPRWLFVHSNAIFAQLIVVALLVFSLGCSGVLTSPPVKQESLLRNVGSNPDSVTIEIFQVRVPADNRSFAKDLWTAADELRLDVELRRRLVDNGFRMGVLGGALPDCLAEQLNLQSKMVEPTTERLITHQTAQPRVTRRVVQVNRHEPVTIQATSLQDQILVLMRGRHGVTGERFQQGQAVYSLRAEQTAGQRVAVQITPELHHGELRNHYSPADQGIFLMTPSREREIYDDLKMKTELAAGELLVMGCLEESTGSLGSVFHASEQDGLPEYKLILVRLMQVPRSEILADAG